MVIEASALLALLLNESEADDIEDDQGLPRRW
jgi:PIN domain nuclease of toxin-antitoxin system